MMNTKKTLVIASQQRTMPCLLCRSPRKFLWNQCQHHRNLAWLQHPCLLHLLFRPRLLPFWPPSLMPSSKCFRPSKLQAFLLGVYPQAWPTPEAFIPRLLIRASLLPKRRCSLFLALALPPAYRPRRLLLLQSDSPQFQQSPHCWQSSLRGSCDFFPTDRRSTLCWRDSAMGFTWVFLPPKSSSLPKKISHLQLSILLWLTSIWPMRCPWVGWQVRSALLPSRISFGVIPKRGQPGKWRLIVDLSSPGGR